MTKVVKRFENCSLENYTCETDEQKKLVAAIKEGIINGFKENIIIIGGVGTGKTHLAYAILNALAEKHFFRDNEFAWYDEKKVAYRTIKSIIDGVKNSWADKECVNPIYELMEQPLLIIDEIGVQYGSDSERTELYELFNSRYEDKKPTIAISNYDLPALQKTLGQRIFDRLAGGALIFELRGKSQRWTN